MKDYRTYFARRRGATAEGRPDLLHPTTRHEDHELDVVLIRSAAADASQLVTSRARSFVEIRPEAVPLFVTGDLRCPLFFKQRPAVLDKLGRPADDACRCDQEQCRNRQTDGKASADHGTLRATVRTPPASPLHAIENGPMQRDAQKH